MLSHRLLWTLPRAMREPASVCVNDVERGSAGLAGPATVRVRSEMARLFVENSAVPVVVVAAVGALVLFVFWGLVPQTTLIGWFAVVLAISGVRYGLAVRLRRGIRESVDPAGRANVLSYSVALSGISWGAAGIVFFLPDSPTHQMFLAFVFGGLVAGTVVSYAYWVPAFLAYAVPSLLPLAARLIWEGTELAVTMGVTVIIFIAAASALVRNTNRSLSSMIAAKFKTEDELRAARDDMETRIQERTRELSDEVEERKRAEDALRRSEAILRSVADNAPISILLKDRDRRFVMANAYLCRLLGVEEKEVLGKTVFDFSPRELAEDYDAADRRVLETCEAFEREILNKTPEGLRPFLEIKFPVMDSEGGVAGVGTVSTDLSERKRLEERLISSQKMEALGQVTGGVAHEFNNILQAMTGSLGVLKKSVQGDAQGAQMIALAEKAAWRGSDLTNRLLSFVGRYPVHPKVVNLQGPIEEAAYLLRPAMGRTIELHLDVAEDLWPVSVDRSLFDGAILNLAINARDAMPNGGEISIAAENGYLDTRAAGEGGVVPGDYVKVTVRDNGRGMPPDVKEQAFEPFFTTKEVGKGTGLGLSMVFGFVRRHSHGHITIDSEVGSGTAITLYLPRAAGEPEAEAAAAASGEVAKPLRVLIVEDDAIVRRWLSVIVETTGGEVVAAGDGDQAIAILQDDPHIDLVLSDIVMPGRTSGVELARRILSDRPNISVILMSGHSREVAAGEGMPLGRVGYLQKPFKERDLIAKLAEIGGATAIA